VIIKSPCPVCEATVCRSFKQKNRFETVQSFSPSSSDFGIFFDLFKCQGCGAVFSLEYPDYKNIEFLYLNSDHEGYLAESKNRQATFRRIIKLVKGYLGVTNAPISLLDIGASAGLFLHTVQESEPTWSVSGIEASRQAVAACKSRFGIDLIHGMLEDMPLEVYEGKYDVISMFDIIEHVQEPLKMMQKASALLKVGGILVVTTPNIESWTSKILQSRWWSYRLMHNVLFSRQSMRHLMSRSSLQVIRMRGLIRLFSLGYCMKHLGWSAGSGALNVSFPLALGDMLVFARKIN
jgi:2-polyprenyl-3-methyl-5-hydroxy-6-metoxy-1,4-benzoquinol methylase